MLREEILLSALLKLSRDDIADPCYGKSDAVLSNDIICDIQQMKRLKFSTEKCRLLEIISYSFYLW